MYLLQRLAVALLVALLSISPLDARLAKRRTGTACASNTECLQKGLPPLPPRLAKTRRVRRQFGQPFVPVTTTTCGTASSVFLPVGSYSVTLSGARGSANALGGSAANAGGDGARLTATLSVASNITVGYFVGCPGGVFDDAVGGGGGGSFLYLQGTNAPAILVAGGGGGGGYDPNRPGRPAGRTFDGVATTNTGSPGAQGGQGGVAVTGDAASFTGGGGGGFITAGGSAGDGAGGGGSQSMNYGGTFAGGSGNGGAGGGGGAGFVGGGGGGGFSGGSGGPGSVAETPNTGGGGGGSYANTGTPGGITVTPGAIIASPDDQGSLVIAKL